MTKCIGRSAVSGERIEIELDGVIKSVDPLLTSAADDGIFIAPGFVDLQVNGFAGVDFNSPATPHQDIQQTIAALFSTGVTRFFPTVITGEPGAMLTSL